MRPRFKMEHYSFEATGDGIGPRHEFRGPGLSRYSSYSHLIDNELIDHEAERIVQMLEQAFEAGRNAKSEEIRAVLGVHNTPWGVKVG